MLTFASTDMKTREAIVSGVLGAVAAQPQPFYPWPNGVNRPSRVLQGVAS